jgi:hypothetical protein
MQTCQFSSCIGRSLRQCISIKYDFTESESDEIISGDQSR